MPEDQNEEELMKNLSDGEDMPGGILHQDQVPQTAEEPKELQ